MKNIKCQSMQQGMTLIEIMIALIIGVFLLTGVLQIYLSTTKSYRMMENQSRLQESGRFAMDFMSHDLRQAGYRNCWQLDTLGDISGTNNDGLNNSDSITLPYSTSACPTNDEPIIYTIADGAGGEPSLFRSDDGNNQELIESIEDMQILYGADTNADSTPDYYVAAGTVGLDMSQVVSIRITLIARTLDANLTETGDGRLRRTFISTVAVRNQLP